MPKDVEPKIALFIDYDNIAIGLRESGSLSFDARKILERMLEKGRIIYKRAYADWSLFPDGKQPLHEAGIELIDIPSRRSIGKNSADIRLVVDALDLCYTKEHIDTFVIGSGDSDFSPLVSKLKENDKHVIGFGLRGSTSNLLADNCDQFIFYEELVDLPLSRPPLPPGLSKNQHDAFSFLLDAVGALMRENKDVLWGSLVKDTIRRKRPSFSESRYGYSVFSHLLEDAASHQLIGLIKDPKSGGTPVITGYGPHNRPEALSDSPSSNAAPGSVSGSSLVVHRDARLHTSPVTGKLDESESSKKSESRNSLVSRTRVASTRKKAAATSAKKAPDKSEDEASSKNVGDESETSGTKTVRKTSSSTSPKTTGTRKGTTVVKKKTTRKSAASATKDVKEQDEKAQAAGDELKLMLDTPDRDSTADSGDKTKDVVRETGESRELSLESSPGTDTVAAGSTEPVEVKSTDEAKVPVKKTLVRRGGKRIRRR